jgi:acetylglutamate kinase
MRVVMKLGGRAIEQQQQRRLVAAETAQLRGAHEIVVVHGGGKRVTATAERLGINSHFEDGVRMTSPAEMEVVDMVLAGAVNTDMVRAFNAAGVPAVGLTGADAGLLTAEPVTNRSGTPTRTGTPARTNAALLEQLLNGGYVPICGSVATGPDGSALNVNADTFALALAAEIRAQACLFISDTEGVVLGGRLQGRLTETDVERAVAEGEIAGGMVPKVRSALEALKAGAAHAVIADFRQEGDIGRMLRGQRGTRILPGEETAREAKDTDGTGGNPGESRV